MNWITDLIKNAYAEANKDNKNKPDYTSEGHCLNSVENVLEKTLSIKARRPASAYQFPSHYDKYADFLKNYTRIENTQPLKSLPLGSIVVWNRTTKHPHGHIEIKIKQPLEFVSDYIHVERKSYDGQVIPLSIYVPKT